MSLSDCCSFSKDVLFKFLSWDIWHTSNCVSKEKETRKYNFSLSKIFLKQYFGLNFRRLKVKQEPKSTEYEVLKRLNFVRFQGTCLNKCYRQGFWCFAEKKAKFRGIFRGKLAEKSADFAGFSREKSQNSQRNRRISRDFSRKKSKFEAFSGANSQKNRPISPEISGGNFDFAKKQSVKSSWFRWIFFGKFCVDMTSVV